MSPSSLFRAVANCFRTLSLVVFDLVRLALLAAHSRTALAAENLFFRWQRMRRKREPCNLWSRERSLPFRKLAAFTIAMSGAQLDCGRP
jgi:hypothetical protein